MKQETIAYLENLHRWISFIEKRIRHCREIMEASPKDKTLPWILMEIREVEMLLDLAREGLSDKAFLAGAKIFEEILAPENKEVNVAQEVNQEIQEKVR